AHTNADAATGGVNEALAAALELTDLRPLVPAAGQELEVLVVYVPEDDAESVRRALAGAGAGAVGDYTGCAWSVAGVGEFTPHDGADPASDRSVSMSGWPSAVSKWWCHRSCGTTSPRCCGKCTRTRS